MTELKQQTISFLELPAEIRCWIYGYMTENLPIAPHLNDHTGLILSCRQIYAEVECESLKVVAPFIQHMQEEWVKYDKTPDWAFDSRNQTHSNKFIVSIPTSFHQTRLELGFDADLVCMPGCHCDFHGFFSLLLDHLASFTLYAWRQNGTYTKFDELQADDCFEIYLNSALKAKGVEQRERTRVMGGHVRIARSK